MIKKMGEERTRRGEVGSGHKFTKCRVLYVLWHVIMMIMEEYMICVKRKILLNLLCIEEMDFQSKIACGCLLAMRHRFQLEAPSYSLFSNFLCSKTLERLAS